MTFAPRWRRAAYLAEARMWLAYLSGAFGLSMFAMLGLLIPLRADELGISVSAIGLMLAARAAAGALLAVPLSRLISRVGARAAFTLYAAGSAASAVAFTLTQSFWPMLLASVAIGAASTGGWVASQDYIASVGLAEDRARHTGRFSFVSNASQMIVPVLIGSSAALLGYRSTFLVLAAYCGAFVLVGAALPAPSDHASGERAHLRAAGRLFRVPRLQVAMLLTFVRLWVPTIWMPFFPLILVTGGASPRLAGAVLSFSAVVGTAVSLLTGRLCRNASPEAVCTVALCVAVVGLVLSPHMLAVPLVYLPAAMVGIGNGLSLPLLIVLVSEAAPMGQRGLALATRNAVNSASAAFAPLAIAPIVATLGASAGFLAAGGLAGSLLAAAAAVQRRSRLTGGHPPSAA